MGAEMVAISPQDKRYDRALIEKHSLGFPLLHDPGNRVAGEFGVVWTLPEDMRQVYLEFGLDIPRYNGDESWRLPMPARFVVDQAGIIRSVEVHPDYTTRPEPAETVEVLRRFL
jgi:peroxiredoxin